MTKKGSCLLETLFLVLLCCVRKDSLSAGCSGREGPGGPRLSWCVTDHKGHARGHIPPLHLITATSTSTSTPPMNWGQNLSLKLFRISPVAVEMQIHAMNRRPGLAAAAHPIDLSLLSQR